MGKQFNAGERIIFDALLNNVPGQEEFIEDGSFLLMDVAGRKYVVASEPRNGSLKAVSVGGDTRDKLRNDLNLKISRILGQDAYIPINFEDVYGLALFDPETYVKKINPGAGEALKDYLEKPKSSENLNGNNGHAAAPDEDKLMVRLRQALEHSRKSHKIVGMDNGRAGVIAVARGVDLVQALRDEFRQKFQGRADPYVHVQGRRNIAVKLDHLKALTMAFATASRPNGGFGAAISKDAAVAVITDPKIYNKIKDWPNFAVFSGGQ